MEGDEEEWTPHATSGTVLAGGGEVSGYLPIPLQRKLRLMVETYLVTKLRKDRVRFKSGVADVGALALTKPLF